jgi:hypothetical protein
MSKEQSTGVNSSDTEGYSGWPNYETWLVNLWLDNDERTYRHWRAEASKLTAWELARVLETAHKDTSYDLTGATGLWADLIGAALSRVDWRSIADHLKEE